MANKYNKSMFCFLRVLVENLVKISDKETSVDLIDNLMDIIDLEIITFKDKITVMIDGMFQ
jgi:hypothetical protein